MKEVRMKREHLLRCLLLPILLSCLFSLGSLRSASAQGSGSYATCVATQHDDQTIHGSFRYDTIEVYVSSSIAYRWELHFVYDNFDLLENSGNKDAGQIYDYTDANDSYDKMVDYYGKDFQEHHYYYYVVVFPDDNSTPTYGGYGDQKWYMDENDFG